MHSNCWFKPMLLTAACLATMPVFGQETGIQVPAETVCTRVVEPQITGPVPKEVEFAAVLTIKDGRPISSEITVVRGSNDRRSQRALLSAVEVANRQLRCEGFNGKVTRRFVIPATPPAQP